MDFFDAESGLCWDLPPAFFHVQCLEIEGESTGISQTRYRLRRVTPNRCIVGIKRRVERLDVVALCCAPDFELHFNVIISSTGRSEEEERQKIRIISTHR
jgi:hypothetical protein